MQQSPRACGPLDGIVVADFSHVMAGPLATHLLVTLGATVVKIEAPGRGDAMRDYRCGPECEGLSPAFVSANAGKKSIQLDLKDAEDHETALQIVDRADVLIENFRPGVIARLGLGYEPLIKRNSDLIYCSVSGYGQEGPLREWPAIDNIVQATSGMMSLNGEDGDPPTRVGFPLVDTLTAQAAAFAILAALYRRDTRGGGGEFIDVSMLDATLAFMTSAVTPYLVSGKALGRTGNTGYSGQPTSGVFICSDGRQVSLGVVQQAQFEKFVRLVGREQWLADHRYSSPLARLENAAALNDDLAALFASQPAAHWEHLLSTGGLPCGMVRTVEEACNLPGLWDRELFRELPQELPAAGGKRAAVVGPGMKMASFRWEVGRVPRAGEDEAEIRRWLTTSSPRTPATTKSWGYSLA